MVTGRGQETLSGVAWRITGLLYLSCDAAGKAFSGPGNLSYFGDIPSHLDILASTDYERATLVVGGIIQMAFVCPEPLDL